MPLHRCVWLPHLPHSSGPASVPKHEVLQWFSRQCAGRPCCRRRWSGRSGRSDGPRATTFPWRLLDCLDCRWRSRWGRRRCLGSREVWVFSVCQKSILSNRFATLFTPFNQMIIFSSKSSCSSGTFTNVLCTSLLTKIFNENTNYFQILYSAFFQLYCVLFSVKLAIIAARSYTSAAYVFMRCLSVCLCVRHVRGLCQNE